MVKGKRESKGREHCEAGTSLQPIVWGWEQGTGAHFRRTVGAHRERERERGRQTDDERKEEEEREKQSVAASRSQRGCS